MRTIYLNTATKRTTIALFDEEKVIGEKQWAAEFNEAERLQPAVQELLQELKLTPDDVDRLVCCVGPGGFTSVRVGVSAVNAWSFAKGVPSAAISIFDLYKGGADAIVVSANPKEAWIQRGEKDPLFAHRDEVSELLESFSFSGILNGEWRTYLEEQGGRFIDEEEALPSIALIHQLDFQQQVLKPWYYKDPNITLSKKVLSFLKKA